VGQQRDQELWKAVEMVVGWFVNFATHTLDHLHMMLLLSIYVSHPSWWPAKRLPH
jgi:hypothetical protein